MKKTLRLLAWIVGIFIAANLFAAGFSTRDYGLECTRCLQEYQIVDHRFCGVTYWRTQRAEANGNDLTELTGAPCQHIYRTNGFGDEQYSLISVSFGDGITAEGILFRQRWAALTASFKLYQLVPDKALMRETLSFIDTCLPPDATIQHQKEYSKQIYLLLLADSLSKATTPQDWQSSLKSVEAQEASDGMK